MPNEYEVVNLRALYGNLPWLNLSVDSTFCGRKGMIQQPCLGVNKSNSSRFTAIQTSRPRKLKQWGGIIAYYYEQ